MMARYNLSSSMSDRIVYDDANRMYFQEQLVHYIQTGGDLAAVSQDTFNTWFDLDQEDVDDTEEAQARAWSAFCAVLDEARRRQ